VNKVPSNIQIKNYEHVDRLLQLIEMNGDKLVTPIADDKLRTLVESTKIPIVVQEGREIFKREMLSTLKKSFQRYGLSLSRVKKYEKKNIYLDSVSNFFLFYLAWLKVHDFPLDKIKIAQLFESCILGTLGYRILDLHFDERGLPDQEAIMGMALIQQHEKKLLDVFGYHSLHFELIQECKDDYFSIEVREKASRGKHSPYSFDKPIECGYKAATIFPAFALALATIGRVTQIRVYKHIFYSITATVQILDDLADLEEDLIHRQFTLPTSGLENLLSQMSPVEAAKTIYRDINRITKLYHICCKLLRAASELTDSVDDPAVGLVVEYKLFQVHRTFLGKEIRR
jgi:hypothetical protein